MSTPNDILHEYLQMSKHFAGKFRESYGSLNLTYPQSIVLAILESDGPMPISALAEAAGSANSTTSGVVDRLEKMQLVQRIRSENDRRVIYVSTTDRCQQEFSKVRSSTADLFSAALSDLSPQEIDQIAESLTLLNKTLQGEDR